MKKIVILIVFPVITFIFSYAFAQTAEHIHKPHPHKHKQYAKVKNPIPMSEQSIAKGRKILEKYCTECHGEASKGNEKTDLTDNLWIHGDSDGEIFHVIMDGTKGPTPMKGFKKELTKEMRWHIVSYIKSLKKTGGTGQ
ncbi:MAG: c-type cytochrome [Thermodesulfovibrionales bacterium]|nr:c-type cytochrome [Thermodesulfovibrionales bacterium]